jgi:biopolymer transport protein ExbB/TolQ
MTQITTFLTNLDVVILFSASVLVLFSCLSWFLILRNSARFIRAFFYKVHQPKLWQQEQTMTNFLTQKSDVATAKQRKSFNQKYGDFAQLAFAGKHAYNNYSQTTANAAININDYLASQLKLSIQKIIRPYNSGLTLLASIAASSPFIGLFGTVWGIYNTLKIMGSSQGISINNIATPIGEALVITALGLAVAIPALLAYNLLLSRSKKLQGELNYFAQQWHNYLLTNIMPHQSH